MHKRSQDKEEEEELDPIHLARRRNVLTAPLLADLLDARKSVSNPNELRNVADKYNMEVELVERLGQVVNSPSVLKQTPLDVKRDVVHVRCSNYLTSGQVGC